MMMMLRCVVNMEEKEGRLTAGVHETTSDWWWRLAPAVGAFHFVVIHSSSLIHFPSSIGFHFSQRQPDEGWQRMERAASRGL